jgi:hypothetical protein
MPELLNITIRFVHKDNHEFRQFLKSTHRMLNSKQFKIQNIKIEAQAELGYEKDFNNELLWELLKLPISDVNFFLCDQRTQVTPKSVYKKIYQQILVKKELKSISFHFQTRENIVLKNLCMKDEIDKKRLQRYAHEALLEDQKDGKYEKSCKDYLIFGKSL